MKKVGKGKTVTVGPVGVKMARDFARESYSSSVEFYKSREQHDAKKIENDIFCGKLSELATYKKLHSIKDCKIEMPDLETYNEAGNGPGKKNYDADLTAFFNGKEYNIHVKSCRASSYFEESWLFQKGDSLTHSPKGNDLIVFTTILNDNTVVVRGAIKAINLVGLYKKPKLDRLKTKKVIYSKDI